MIRQIIFLPVLFLLCCLPVTSILISVSRDNGDNSKCLDQDVPCESLEFVSAQLGGICSGLTVLITDLQLVVSGLVSFENCTSLKISGKTGSNTKLSCLDNVGFKFWNITNLTLLNMEIRSCGCAVGHIQFSSTAVMHVHRCSNVALTNMVFYNSSFTALVMSDVMDVTITNCSFLSSNPLKHTLSNTLFPGGVHIQFSTNYFDTTYRITECLFQNNTKESYLKIEPHPSLSPSFSAEYGYGLGGGMGILFMNGSQNITMLIRECNFSHNKARSGAGLYIHFEYGARGNAVLVINSNFTSNNGTAGGGLALGMSKVSGNGNLVNVNGSEFTANEGRFGGGTAVFALHGDKTKSGDMKLIKFYQCSWRYNSGRYSPAVDLSAFRSDQFNSGYLPTPQFTDCTFSFNIIQKTLSRGTSHFFSGVFVVSSLTVYFGGRTTFSNNKYSALKMTAGRAHLLEGTEMRFTSNEGSGEGGAIAMYGSSALVGRRNCFLHFDNNSATSVGGAIVYGPSEQREFLEGKSCFLQYAGNETKLIDRNFTFLFTRNSAQLGGSSIYATSFYSCFFSCHSDLKKYNLVDFLECIGTFKFQDSSDNTTALRSRGIKYNYTMSGPLHIIPGQQVTIPISLNDEFGQKSQNMLIVKREGAKQDSAIFAQNSTRVYGTPLENSSLLFRTQDSFRSAQYKIPITFLNCPPGFYFDPKAESCNCSADNSRYAYQPIVKCNYTTFRALILSGYWAGTCGKACTNHTRLYVSSQTKITSFVQRYDTANMSVSHTSLNELPQTVEELNSFMCGEGRRGVLCGRCHISRSPHYHSRIYRCGSKRLCHLGSLFYLLSEIIPVVIAFTIILRYDIDFQSGCLNGFVLFCQVADISVIKLSKLDHSSTAKYPGNIFRYIQSGYRLVYDVSNLEFFGLESLSFCLWGGAQVLDVFALKYITTVFTLILVFFLYKTMNSRCIRCRGRQAMIQNPVMKGLAAFLVLCYSQCTKTTFQILSREVIVSNEGAPDIPVTAYGGLHYFHSDHLIYAIPALICLLTVIFLPVLYLLIIPLTLQLLSMCGLSEHAIVNTLLKVLYQPKLMPLIDIFQSSFKPKFRFFAGTYFLYRIVIFAVLTFSVDEADFYASLEIAFLAMLGVHAIAQPYKQKRNNLVDGMLFLNLALITGLNKLSNSKIIFITSVQLMLVSAPLLILICGYFFLAAQRKFPCVKIFCRKQETEYDYEEISDRGTPSEDVEDFYGNGEERNSVHENSLDTY